MTECGDHHGRDPRGRYVRMLSSTTAAIRRLSAGYERDPSRRQDLVQDIWLALWQALPSFRGDCAERTFVFRIAHNRAVSHIQHWRRRRTEPLPDDAPVAAWRRLTRSMPVSQQQRRERAAGGGAGDCRWGCGRSWC